MTLCSESCFLLGYPPAFIPPNEVSASWLIYCWDPSTPFTTWFPLPPMFGKEGLRRCEWRYENSLLLTIGWRNGSQIVFRFFAPAAEGKGPPCCNSNVSFRWGCCEEGFCLVLNYYLFGFATATKSVSFMTIQLGNSMICFVSECCVGFGDFLGLR
jgi:hypothetical protein